jgi:hypothetical protein
MAWPLYVKLEIAGDDEEPPDAGERSNDLLDHAVGEIFLIGVAAHIGERHYRDRRLVGKRRAGTGGGRGAALTERRG